jgi:hypothetical protein
MDRIGTILTAVIWIALLIAMNLGYISVSTFRISMIVVGVLYLVFWYRAKLFPGIKR